MALQKEKEREREREGGRERQREGERDKGRERERGAKVCSRFKGCGNSQGQADLNCVFIIKIVSGSISPSEAV